MSLRKVKDFKEIITPPQITPYNKQHIFSGGKYWIPLRAKIKLGNGKDKKRWEKPKYEATFGYVGLTLEEYIKLKNQVTDSMAEYMLPGLLKYLEEEKQKQLQNEQVR